MKLYTKLLAFLILSFTSISATMADESFSVKAGYMLLYPSGDIAATDAGIAGTNLDVDSDLRLGSSFNSILEAHFQYVNTQFLGPGIGLFVRF